MWFIDGFNLVINPVLEGFLNMDSWISGAPHTHQTFTNLELTYSPNITAPLSGSGFSLFLGNFSYGWRFYANWRLEIDFTSVLNLFFPDLYFDLFTYPNISVLLLSLSPTITVCSYAWNPSSQKYTLS
jgi:hypothetical protein